MRNNVVYFKAVTVHVADKVLMIVHMFMDWLQLRRKKAPGMSVSL